jgi:hypothetical protein
MNFFLLTDAGRDPVLTQILEECGCGHLLKFAEHAYREFLIRGVARQTREYLGLGDAGAGVGEPCVSDTGVSRGADREAEAAADATRFLGDWVDGKGRTVKVVAYPPEGFLITLLGCHGKEPFFKDLSGPPIPEFKMPATPQKGKLVARLGIEDVAMVLSTTEGGGKPPRLLLGMGRCTDDGSCIGGVLMGIFQPRMIVPVTTGLLDSCSGSS